MGPLRHQAATDQIAACGERVTERSRAAGRPGDRTRDALRNRPAAPGIDATEKRAPLDRVEQPWPDEILMSDEVRQRVTTRWREYGLG